MLLGIRRFGGLQFCFHHWNEGAVHQLAYQFRRCVVGASLFALGSGGQSETVPSIGLFVFGQDHRAVVQQTFIDGAELLHVEVGVVDPAGHIAITEGGQVAQGVEECLVGAESSFQVLAGGLLEELAVHREKVHGIGGHWITEQAEGLSQALPKVAMGVTGKPVFGPLSQTGDTVIALVDVVEPGVVAVVEEYLPFLSYHQEQQAIHEAEQLAVVGVLAQSAAAEGVA